MSQRIATLCDFNSGTPCQQPATGKCPLCDRDACSFHFGSGYAFIGVHYAPASHRDIIHGGHEKLHACIECMRTLERGGTQPNIGDFAALLRALCAAIRLAPEEKK